MISYSQNREDVLLARVFKGQQSGYYVDIGAGHPWVDSVTCHFYLQGWRGLNVEPRPSMAGLLQQWRPLHQLAQCVVSEQRGQTEFFEVNLAGRCLGDGGGLSTVDSQLATKHARAGFEVVNHSTPVHTLASLLAEYQVGDIDFLKIDVEGHEGQVIMGGDWSRWRPRVIIAESIDPVTHVDASTEWRPHLEQHGYLFAAFDGLNSYFVREEDRELAAKLYAPVNVLDKYKTWQTHLIERRLHSRFNRRWRKIVATNKNVPRGLGTVAPGPSLLQRWFSR